MNNLSNKLTAILRRLLGETEDMYQRRTKSALEALFQSELEKAEKRGYAAGVKADKQAVSEIVEKAKKDEAGNIYKMAEDIVLAKPASSIVAGGTDLDKLMNQLERKYGKDLIQHVYGDHNKLESQKERIDK